MERAVSAGRACLAAPPHQPHSLRAALLSSRFRQPSSRRATCPQQTAAAHPHAASSQQPNEAQHAAATQDASSGRTPDVQEVAAAAARGPAAFAALLRRLAERGSGATKAAHLVAAWAAQRGSPGLRPGARRQVGRRAYQETVEAMAALEELTQQQLTALTPDQLGYVARCYVLAGGGASPLMLAMQQAAGGWQADDFSAAGLAELAWALASSRQPLSDACRQLLRSALQCDAGGGAASGEPQQSVEQAEGQRDWAAWFEGTPASRTVLLLWAAAHLDCRPSAECLAAAAAAALREDAGLATLPTKSVATLLWSLASLRIAQQPQLLQAVQPLLAAASRRLAARMEAALDVAGSLASSDSSSEGDGIDDVLASAEAAQPTQHHGGWGDGGNGDGSRGPAAAAAAAAAGGAAAAARDLPTSTLCTAVWACGQLQHGDTQLLRAASTLLHGRVPDMSPADTARTLWGLGQLGYCPATLLDAVAAHLQRQGVLAAFEPRQLAMTTYAFAALDFFPGQDCVDQLADAALAAAHRFEPRAAAHVLWNMSRLGHVDDPFFLAFIPVILPSIRQYGPAELADVARVYSRAGLNPAVYPDSTLTVEEGVTAALAAAMGGYGSSAGGGGSSSEGSGGSMGDGGGGGGEGGTLFDALAAQTVARIGEADIHDILRIMTAFHQMGLQPVELLAAAEGWADQRLRRLPPQALSLALWSFARMGSGSPKLLETATACAEAQLAAFTPPQLAQVAWSFAKMRWPATRVLRHAGAQLAAHTASFMDKEASNVLWALASEGLAPPAGALDGIAAALQPRLRAFGPQSLANVAWSYATLGHVPPPPFLELLGAAAAHQLRAFEPQGLSLLAWSLASLGFRHNRLLSDIVALCLQRPALLRQFEGQHLANLLWGLCRAGFRPPPAFLDLLAEEAELRICDFKPQELFNTAWALTKLGHHPRRLYGAIAAEVAPRAFAFTPQELSGTLWALAKAGHAGPALLPLLHAVEHEVAARGASFEDRHVAIIAWSFGQLGHVPAPADAAPLLAQAELRLPAMAGHSLVTLAAGLAAMEQQRRWRERRQQQQLDEAADADAAESAAEEQSEDVRQHDSAEAALVAPPHLVAAMAERAAELAPGLQPFEVAQLVQALAALHSEAGRFRFLHAPSAEIAQQLQAAAHGAPLPAVVALLWAMAAWRCFPNRLFATACGRLRRASPQYRLPQPALVLLGQAVQGMDERHRSALRLRRGLLFAAVATARAAEQRGPCGALLEPAAAGSSDASDGDGPPLRPAEGMAGPAAAAAASDSDAEEEWQPLQQREEWDDGGGGGGMAAVPAAAAAAAPAPPADNDNLDDGWLGSTYED